MSRGKEIGTPEQASRIIFGLPTRRFLEAVREVSFATDPEIGGILFEFKRDKLTLVANDGHRISAAKIEIENPSKIRSEFSVLARRLEEVCYSFYPGDLRTEEINESRIQLILSSENMEIKPLGLNRSERASFIEYPDQKWRPLVEMRGKGVVFQRKELLEILESFDNEEFVKVVPLEEKGRIRLWQGKPGEITNERLLPVEGNLPSRVAFTHQYLVDLLENVTSEEFRMEVTGEREPVVFRRPGDENYVHLIMAVDVLSREWE